MALCGIIGDSIALGLALANPGCDVSAKTGRSPAAIAAHPLPATCYRYVLISAASNNPGRADVREDLLRIRRAICATRVIWVVPADALNGSYVRYVADSFYDAIVAFSAGRDGVHPDSYARLWTRLHMLLP